MDSTVWIGGRVYPGAGWTYRTVDAYSRVYPPLMETGVRSVAVDKHTSTKQTDIEIELTPLSVENRPCPSKKFF
jgi:hypothetical protein